MMDEEQLKKAIKSYDDEEDYALSPEFQELHAEFLERFPIKSLENITLEEYALGHEGYKDSFCYWIETRLKKFGYIYGSTALKFGVYFGTYGDDKENKWRWANWTNNDFNTIREELNMLLIAGYAMDFDAIEGNRLSPMFKGKILVTYFPDKYLNVFSYEHIKYFLKQLGDEEYPPIEAAKQKLLRIKSRNPVSAGWSNLKFSNFLYTTFGEVHRMEKDAINEVTPEVVGKELSFIVLNGQYKPVSSDSTLKAGDEEKEKRNYKPDYYKAYESKQNTGSAGEKAVVDYEQKILRDANRPDLVSNVKRVSGTSDAIGYDVLSFDAITGDEKHIEVKTTKSGRGSDVVFFITDNELSHLKTDPNYCIYFIKDIYGKNPKILQLDIKQIEEKFAELSQPVLYRVWFSNEE